jgi:acid stress-induced BolA-like protein IbaG/YrbA
MEISDVVARVTTSLPDADVRVEGKDCDFSLTVVYDGFESLPRLKRQQHVLGCFSDVLATGEIHALSIKTYTTSEWQMSQQNSLTQIAPLSA